jgi:hypothetical protein
VDLLSIKIEDIIIKSILSIEDILFKSYETMIPFRDNCFCLLGYDILIDSKLDPWLVEVNLSPSIGAESRLDSRIKGELLSDL